MARPTNLETLISPILDDFARRLAQTIERFTTERVGAQVNPRRDGGNAVRSVTRAAGRRRRVLCYYAYCKNVAAPRFGMFCAALHKDLPKAQKEKHRAQRFKSG